MANILCIYHGGCDDGFAAAWAMRHALGDTVEFYSGVYQQDPPDTAGRHVILVDFSYKRPVLDEIAKAAASVLVLDHHKTAAEDLDGFGRKVQTGQDWLDLASLGERAGFPPIGTLFDMNRSGAGIAWDFFSDGRPRPDFINYIEDRDLWRKALPGGDEFTIALRSYPQDFETWDGLIAGGVDSLIHEGRSIQRYYRLRVEELKRSAYKARIEWRTSAGSISQPQVQHGAIVGIVNAPYFAASEVAGEMATQMDVAFGVSYFEVEQGRWQYSLRSRGDFDVSVVARYFGGGGHPGAAGFTVDAPVHTKV